MKKVLVMHGPNLNLLGEREPGIYGTDTFESINAEIIKKAEELGFECEVFQSNSEGALIDKLHAARLLSMQVHIHTTAMLSEMRSLQLKYP